MTRADAEAEPHRNYYEPAFDPADHGLLWDAQRLDGIEDEIAALRLVLRKQLESRPDTYDALVKSMHVLIRAVVTKYQMSPKSGEDFAQRVVAVVRDLGDQMGWWRGNDV